MQAVLIICIDFDDLPGWERKRCELLVLRWILRRRCDVHDVQIMQPERNHI
jgi:hypothetical protein